MAKALAAKRTSGETAGTVARVVLLLRALADVAGPVGVGQLAEAVGLPDSTVHRMLQLLLAEGLVTRDADTHLYDIGAEFYRIAARVVSAIEAPELAEPYIRRIADRFDETTLFCMYLPAQHALSFAARCDGSHALQYRIEMHKPVNLVWGASGKSVLAYLPADVVKETLAKCAQAPVAGHRRPSLTALNDQLEEIRARGYAVSEGEKVAGARGIAVPVFGRKGVVGSIVLTSPRERLPHADIDEIARFAMEQARELSRTLGAPTHS